MPGALRDGVPGVLAPHPIVSQPQAHVRPGTHVKTSWAVSSISSALWASAPGDFASLRKVEMQCVCVCVCAYVHTCVCVCVCVYVYK